MDTKTNKKLKKQLKKKNKKIKELEELIGEIMNLIEAEEEEETVEDIETKLFQNRIIYLHDEISQDSLSQISPLIDYYNLQDEGIPYQQRKPITIKIGTYGGEAYEAIGIIDSIEASLTPVHVHIEGKSMSAGFYIWASAHTRSMGQRSVAMYHQARGQIGGTLTDMQRTFTEWQRLQRNLDNLVIENLGVSQEFLDNINQQNIDWYVDYNEALSLGMLTDVE